MKKALLLLLILCMCMSGCGADIATAPHSFQDLTIQIPVDYIDLSDEEFAQDLSFVFGKDPIALNGHREEKALFAAYGLELDLQRYGDLLMKSNNVTSQLSEKDGILHFSYASGDFNYVVTLWETDEAFWTVQAYCPTQDYSKVQKDIWNILSSVTV
jgi:hypothetical protein